MVQIQPGDVAPSFELEAIELGKRRMVRSSEFIGHYVILFFYPYNFSSFCTLQNCGFRDRYDEIQLNSHRSDKIVILGVSPDRTESHLLFSRKNNLPFLSLSDPDLSVARQYGAVDEQNNNAARPGDIVLRKTFILRPDGHIAYCYDIEDVREHIKQVVIDLRAEVASRP